MKIRGGGGAGVGGRGDGEEVIPLRYPLQSYNVHILVIFFI